MDIHTEQKIKTLVDDKKYLRSNIENKLINDIRDGKIPNQQELDYIFSLTISITTLEELLKNQ